MGNDARRGGRTGRVRIVIADDHTLFREPLLAWFRSEEPDFEIVGDAADGAEAIRVVQEQRPDIVLLDVCMPGLDGLGAARVIAATAPRTRIVVLTGYDDGRHAQAFFDLGAVGYLLKETPLDQLAVLLRAVYAGHTCFGAAAAGKLHASGGAPAASRLTPREAEVLRLVASDRQNAEIAAELCVCVKTVESHVSNVLQKMGVRSRGAAALKAHNLNLL